MASFTRTNGDASGVAVYDVGTYVNGATSGSAGIPIQPQGPKLDFYTGDLGADGVSGQFGTGGAVEAVLRVMAQMSTIHMYQFNNNGVFRVAMYPTGGDAAASLQSAIQALGTVNGYNLAGAVVTAGGLA
jgi:hypothetical protein